jgi:hypothetical protein
MLKAFAGELSMSGLVLASVIIGSLGLLNDMTVTQAAAVWEVSDAAPDTSARHLYHSVMRIGRDHIASSVYTLVLAYAGAALPTLLLFTLADRTSAQVATTDLVAPSPPPPPPPPSPPPTTAHRNTALGHASYQGTQRRRPTADRTRTADRRDDPAPHLPRSTARPTVSIHGWTRDIPVR